MTNGGAGVMLAPLSFEVLDMIRYRVREARVEVCDGFRSRHERRFLAERWVKMFGPIGFWWPVNGGEWRRIENDAIDDIHREIEFQGPLSSPKIYEVKA